eukprot:5259285-Prymnesium_polylepis.1
MLARRTLARRRAMSAIVVRHTVDCAHAPPVELTPSVADLAAVPCAARATLLLIPQDEDAITRPKALSRGSAARWHRAAR